MSGTVFYRTKELKNIVSFYTDKLGMKIWDDQGKCKILSNGNLILGFCESETSEKEAMFTFFYPEKEKVDEMYEKLKDISTVKPRKNPDFNIYQFFAKDPEGRNLEFQCFLYDLNPFKRGDELLRQRRSYRKFKKKDIPMQKIEKIFEDCRFAPTSMNSQSYYYIVIKNREKIEKLASIRGASSQPIKESPIAVAICASNKKTKRLQQDGDIAAYHFILSAFNYGLGTCWIADMNREKVKEILNIPKKDFVSTVTPLGYPKNYKDLPERRSLKKIYSIQK